VTDPDLIPKGLQAHLARELDAVPLATPDPAGARYRRSSGARSGGVRRLLTAGAVAAGAAVLLGAGATAAAGPPQVLHWLQADVDRLPFTAPAATPSPDPASEQPPGGQGVTAPHATEEPGRERGEPAQGPRDGDNGSLQPKPADRDRDAGARPTPRPSATAEGDGDHASPAPSASPDGQRSPSPVND
jgi:hypothetical protein